MFSVDRSSLKNEKKRFEVKSSYLGDPVAAIGQFGNFLIHNSSTLLSLIKIFLKIGSIRTRRYKFLVDSIESSSRLYTGRGGSFLDSFIFFFLFLCKGHFIRNSISFRCFVFLLQFL